MTGENKLQGILSIVGTPIGNLDDISFRAVDTLKSADLILAEDTRVTKRLLERYAITTKVQPFHHHSKDSVYTASIRLLQEGKHLAVVSDAGTPGISDPGNMLVKRVHDTLGSSVRIEPIPGPSALTAALSVAGIATDSFTFYGFIPHKKGRETLLNVIADASTVSIFFESTHRIMKTLESLETKLSEHRNVIVCRELTKKFESVYRGSIRTVREAVAKQTKGEFVIIIGV